MASNEIRAVIFDCDGTLVESEYLQTAALAEMITAQGMPMSGEEAFRRFQGGRMSDLVASLEKQFGRKLPEDFERDFRARVADLFNAKLHEVPGAKKLVESLSVPVAVASNGPREKMKLTLTLTGLLPLFGRHVYSAYEVGIWKPEPGLFLHAAQKLGIAPQHCAVIEDSWTGVEAGLAADMPTYAFQPTFVDPRIPPEVPVVRTLADFHALLPQRVEPGASPI